MGRWARATDANQAAEDDKLRQMGYSVHNTSRLGQGFPDAIVANSRINVLVEWKKDAKQRLTLDEEKFHGKWKGPRIVAITAEEVHAFMVGLTAGLTHHPTRPTSAVARKSAL